MLFKKKIPLIESNQEKTKEEKEREEIFKSLSIMANELWNIQAKAIPKHRSYSTIAYLDDNRRKYVWASVEKDEISITLEEYDDFIRIKPSGKNSIELNSDLENVRTLKTISAFIKRYDKIREDILERVTKDIEEYDKERTEAIDTSKLFNKRYEKEATVEIDLPLSMNRRQMEIRQENGKNIGIIECGDMTLKFITSGDIQFVDLRKEDEKVKKK